MTASFRHTVPEDLPVLAKNLRKADIEELKASTGLTVDVALRESVAASQEVNTIVLDGEPVGIFGVARLRDIVGCPWLVGTDKITTIGLPFLRGSAEWVKEQNDNFPVLVNYVHANNEAAIQWLRFLGFKFIRLIEHYGVGKEPFYEFVRIQDNV